MRLKTGALIAVALTALAGLSMRTAAPGLARDIDIVAPPVTFPAENPYSREKALLGRTLFFDKILSGPRTMSCASCHQPDKAWSDDKAMSVGVHGASAGVRTPSLVGVAWLDTLGWDGHFPSLESVAFSPITSSFMMDLPEAEILIRLSTNPDYAALFERAFGDALITRDRIEKALATFERTIVSTDAPYDRWKAGDETAIDAAAKRGFALFAGKAHCVECHAGPTFTDGSFHDIGTATENDLGRGALFPTSRMLKHAFKTPTLRDVALRAPYMHNGSRPTLDTVIDLYDRGGIARPGRAEFIAPLGLSADEKRDLVAFLHTLTGQTLQSVQSRSER